jgi:hypothetical protein
MDECQYHFNDLADQGQMMGGQGRPGLKSGLSRGFWRSRRKDLARVCAGLGKRACVTLISYL